LLGIFSPRARGSPRPSTTCLAARHTTIDPTLALGEMSLHTKPLDQVEPGVHHLPPQLREALDTPPASAETAAIAEAQWKIATATLRALHSAGIRIVAGTDQAIPGYSLHRELELYVEAGFTTTEVLQAATIQAARAVGVERESGSLEIGKRGDVLLLSADPLADIRNTRAVWRTVAAGNVYDPVPLWQSVGFLP
jgi:imidazolonepropionase-like amidohydrolase